MFQDPKQWHKTLTLVVIGAILSAVATYYTTKAVQKFDARHD